MLNKKFLLLLFLLPLLVQSQSKKGVQVLFTHENDFLWPPNNQDDNYTGGAQLEFLFGAPKWKFYPFYHSQKEGVVNIMKLGIGGTGYTPQILDKEEIIYGDRPYASLLFANWGFVSIDPMRKLIVRSDLILGMVGTEHVGKVQSHVHEKHWFGSIRPVPQGWHNQIGYDGSPVINYSISAMKNLSQSGSNRDFSWIQTNVVGKAEIGTYMINLQAGPKFNFININSSLLQDYMTAIPVKKKKGLGEGFSRDDLETNSQELREQAFVQEQAKSFRFNLFGEPHVRWNLYNTTLEGLMFNDKSLYTIDQGDVNRLVFEIHAGINMILYDNIYLKYSFFGRSQEFSGGKKFHTWGGITVGFSPARWYREF